ncbi:MAG: glyoxalase [Pedobacter sp.]|nr:glyoxalase [Pedobacter sp.]
MTEAHLSPPKSGVYITFTGNCKKALQFYQQCFGGQLQLETFNGKLLGLATQPVVSGSLHASQVTIFGSDLVHEEGRIVGNYVAIFLPFTSPDDRQALIEKLVPHQKPIIENLPNKQKLIEITDAFDVKWLLGLV